MSPASQHVTRLLVAWQAGDQQAFDDLIPLVYHELRRIAARARRHERVGHSLQTTDLVHEAYLRLVGQHDVRWQNRAHFFSEAAEVEHVSERTVHREWKVAKAWLYRAMQAGA